jgi:adenosylmethionine-8-amino-7-oxononanoate aminotransferase
MLSHRYEQLLKRTFLDFQQTSEFLKAPFVVDRAEGLYYWDVAGKRYFDAIGGIFVAVLGHRHPRVVDAMRRQADQLTFAPPLHGIANVTLDFVEKLGSVAPGSLSFVKAFSGGSESTEAAMKFTRQYFKQSGHPGKYKFLSCYGGYHGGTFGAMSASGTGRRKSKFEPQMAGFLKVFSPLYYRDQFNDWEKANRFAAQAFEDVIVAEDPDTVAGILIEPISNTGGIATPTAEFFQLLRHSCDRHNVLLIFDEVITGLARTGRMFAAETFSVTPDILCAGKALSSGIMPLGSMIAREDMADAFFGPAEAELQFAHGHTYAGNPLACAVGIAVIDEILERDLCRKARDLGDYLAGKLEDLKPLGIVREIRGKGVLRGVELVEDASTNRPFPPGRKLGPLLQRTALQNGLIMRIDQDWFALCPALIAEPSDIDEMVALIEKSLKDALNLWVKQHD